MTRILKPIIIENHEKISQICAQFFIEERGFKIIDSNLGNNEIAGIDLLATDFENIYLVTVSTSDIKDALFRSIMAYNWYKENKAILSRIYALHDNFFEMSPTLIILSPYFPHEMHPVLKELCKVPIQFYKYTAFGQEADPDVFIEDISQHHGLATYGEPDLNKLRKGLDIELANLTDEEIKEFHTGITSTDSE